MRNDCFNCQYSYTVEEGPPAECGPCEPQYKSESPSGWTAKGSIMERLTTDNARDGMVVALDNSPDNHYRLRLAGPVDCSTYALPLGGAPDLAKTRLFLGDTDYGMWIIVEDAAGTPLVALDPQNPPPLPPGHVDAPSRTLQALDGLCDKAIGRMEALLGEIKEEVGGKWQVIAQGILEILHEQQALIGNKANSVLTKPDSESDAADRLSGIIAGIADLHAQMLDTYNKLYGTVEVAGENEEEVDHG